MPSVRRDLIIVEFGERPLRAGNHFGRRLVVVSHEENGVRVVKIGGWIWTGASGRKAVASGLGRWVEISPGFFRR